MHTPEYPFSLENEQNLIGDIDFAGEELTDDDLMLAAGGLMRVDVETLCYDENGKVVDHQIDIFYV